MLYAVFEQGVSDTGHRFDTEKAAREWIDNIDPEWRKACSYTIRPVTIVAGRETMNKQTATTGHPDWCACAQCRGISNPQAKKQREAHMQREADRQFRAAKLVKREVLCCVSTIVHGLAGNEEACAAMDVAPEEVFDVCQRDDWQTAAEEEGWEWDGDAGVFSYTARTHRTYFPDSGNMEPTREDWRELCEARGIDPHTREAYEHWAVSDWLGRRLEAAGEMVAFDFAGMPAVWGRCCTGQAISLDDVVQRIACDGHND